jgi:hypothetical protein
MKKKNLVAIKVPLDSNKRINTWWLLGAISIEKEKKKTT